MKAILPHQVSLRAAGHLTLQPRHFYRAPRFATQTSALFNIGQKATSNKREEKKSEARAETPT